jgi:hypothetical protein
MARARAVAAAASRLCRANVGGAPTLAAHPSQWVPSGFLVEAGGGAPATTMRTTKNASSAYVACRGFFSQPSLSSEDGSTSAAASATGGSGSDSAFVDVEATQARARLKAAALAAQASAGEQGAMYVFDRVVKVGLALSRV